MGTAKHKAVISADAEHLAEVEILVRDGKFRTISEFVREAMREKLERTRATRLAEQVSEYCRHGYQHEDSDLVAAQAFPDAKPPSKRSRSRRKPRRAL